MANPEVRRFKLWQDRIQTEVEIIGNGPPLVWLPGPWGLNPDRAFVEQLASGNTVYAPRFPGTTRGDPNAVHALVGWLDLAAYRELEAFAQLGTDVDAATQRQLDRGEKIVVVAKKVSGLRAQPGKLLLGGFLMGVGFNIKMAEVLLPLPAFYALYFFGSKVRWVQKAFNLFLATSLFGAIALEFQRRGKLFG